MSIIQQIRDKAAWLVFGVIALSLIGFIFMDARTSRLFGGSRSTVVGTINGEKIEYNDFQRQVSEQEEQAKMRGYPMNESIQQNIRESVWAQIVESALLSGDYSTLGLDVSDKEVNDMLVGANAIPDVKQAFTDPKTGIFDQQAAAAQINQLRNIYKGGPKKTAADQQRYEGARRFFEESLPQIIKLRLREKYTALFTNSAYVPKWMIEKMNADNSQIASISYVNAPYFTIPDSSVKITDAEVQEYINGHKDQFKQEESRSIAFVTFDASPSSADSAKLRQQLTELSGDFVKASDISAFFGRVGTEQPFFDGYIGKSRIQVPSKDSIFALQKGQVFGPYLDGGSYTLAKLIDVKTLPDSVRARHILVATGDPRSGQQIMDDSVAKKKIDSIKSLVERGERFDSLAARLSDDPGSKEKGGDLGYFTSDRMVKEFADFCFNGKTGEKKVVKSQFGYHYIEILDQKNFEPAYKVAYLSRKIETSPETDQAAAGLANQFAAESRDAKAFDASVQKSNLQKQFLPDVSPSEYSILGLGPNRQLVRWIYDAKVGEVSEPYTVGDKYVVVLLTEVNQKGTMSVAKARPRVEPILRNKKKAEQLVKKLGNPASLDAAATAAGQAVMRADSLRFSSAMIPNAGQEPKVVGVAFDKQLAGKPVSSAISGNAGVYFIKVENVSAVSNPEADVQQQRFMQEMRQRGQVANMLVEALRKLADIEDNRSKFY
ncbi:MAG: peptidylprolyl isomerase [Bacteroidetes bacterium]|nr:peptidylprolyl isomerase [Bacteroidota bacterium]